MKCESMSVERADTDEGRLLTIRVPLRWRHDCCWIGAAMPAYEAWAGEKWVACMLDENPRACAGLSARGAAMKITPEMMDASRARPGDIEDAGAVFDAARNGTDAAGPMQVQRFDLAAIVPIASARKPRSAKQFAADIHNAHLLIRYDHGESPSSRKYVELVDTEAKQFIARDPMPSIMSFGPDGVLAPEYVELPGPNCLDTLSDRLKLTDEERAMFRTRREDAALLLAEYAEIRRSELEMP